MKNTKGENMAINKINGNSVQAPTPSQQQIAAKKAEQAEQERLLAKRQEDQKRDKYTVSPLTSEIKANSIATQSKEQLEKLDKIAQQIKDGTFKVDSKAIAEKMMKDKDLMKMLLN